MTAALPFSTLHTSSIPELKLLQRGKVRDVYELAADTLLIVASDRLSAFDVVLPDPIPGKGEILTAMSNFWFAQTAQACPNHLLSAPLPGFLDPALYRHRSVVARKLRPLPIEAIARGYLLGSGFKQYQQTGAVCGITLPPGLVLADQLAKPIFTPSTKAGVGQHDENISFDQVVWLLGGALAEQMRAATMDIFALAQSYAETRGILIADTKLEFGLTPSGELLVMDEMLTPDSSRFWPKQSYRAGSSPPSFDKQFVRDYLETLDWNKQAPGPRLPTEVIAGTRDRYLQALRLLTQGP